MLNTQPDLRLLNTFTAVVRLGSMTAAATTLGYAPSAVSQHVTALERSLGVELFARRPGSHLVVTAEGRALAEAAAELFSATAAFQDVARRITGGEVGELRVGAYGTALSHLLPTMLKGLAEAGIGAAIRMTEVETHEGLPLLDRGELDLLIAYRYLPDDLVRRPYGVTMTPLGQERLPLITAPMEVGAPDFSACRKLDWVAGGPDDVDRKLLDRWAAAAGFTPNVRYQTADCHTAIELIACGLAVGLVPESVANGWQHEGRPVSVVRLPSELEAPSRDVLALTRSRGLSLLDQLLPHFAAALEEATRSDTAP
ncbi:LysR family transcriptional regulator [Streptomyces sp. NPDC059134]|uniref:LysR family transcriptional regulator n=1 Tax=Streptomyces sp. NPDC059134 TaxID=3346738 RepID=UPI00367ED0BE